MDTVHLIISLITVGLIPFLIWLAKRSMDVSLEVAMLKKDQEYHLKMLDKLDKKIDQIVIKIEELSEK